jgi:cyclophilin family peptidyl-prolyl cis-trans isomerase
MSWMQGHHTLKGASIHKVQPQFAIFGGLTVPHSTVARQPCRLNNMLQHIESGVLSVHKDGSHFAITLSRALALDANYLVIGRVGKGTKLLSDFNNIQTDFEDAPESPLTVVLCGTTDHRGLNDTLSGPSAGGASSGGAVAAMRGTLAAASAGVMNALAQGLKRKQHAAGNCRSMAEAGGAAKKIKGLAMGMLSDDEDDESDSDVV